MQRQQTQSQASVECVDAWRTSRLWGNPPDGDAAFLRQWPGALRMGTRVCRGEKFLLGWRSVGDTSGLGGGT